MKPKKLQRSKESRATREPLSLHPLTPEKALKTMLGGSTGQTAAEATVPEAEPEGSKR
jgi:hypothetical protein